MGYGMDDWNLIPSRGKKFLSFPKYAARAWQQLGLLSNMHGGCCTGIETIEVYSSPSSSWPMMVELHLHSLTRLHGIVLN
jgi:hypothetical protein